MQTESKEFLYSLLTTPSPTGFEQEIQRVVKKRMAPFAETIETDLHGNLIIGINTKAERKVMLAGHCDQIGLMVKHITKEGYIYVASLGGIDAGVILGTPVTVWGKDGPIPGVIGRKPIHLMNGEERDKAKADIDKIWIDIGAKDKKEVEKKVTIGDSITFRLGVTELANDLICSPALDDKAGLFVAMEAFRLCAKAKLNVALYAVSTVQEEVGLRGATTSAFSVDPEVGIAVDVTHASDNPGQENAKAIPCKLGAGPCISRGPNTNPIVHKMLVSAAKKVRTPYQIEPHARPHGNDANAMQISRRGVATASLDIPNRYMHTPIEVCSLKDMENAAKVLAQFIKDIDKKTDFRPC